MTTPDEPGAGLRAIINQVPKTMTATRETLLQMQTTFGADMAGAQRVSVDKFNEWIAHTALCISALESRLERLEGRHGMPDGAIGSILREFSMDD